MRGCRVIVHFIRNTMPRANEKVSRRRKRRRSRRWAEFHAAKACRAHDNSPRYGQINLRIVTQIAALCRTFTQIHAYGPSHIDTDYSMTSLRFLHLSIALCRFLRSECADPDEGMFLALKEMLWTRLSTRDPTPAFELPVCRKLELLRCCIPRMRQGL